MTMVLAETTMMFDTGMNQNFDIEDTGNKGRLPQISLSSRR